MKTETALQTIIFLALLALLQGCGFHLRGTGTSAANLPADISPLLIRVWRSVIFLKLELENMFINSGIRLPMTRQKRPAFCVSQADRRPTCKDRGQQGKSGGVRTA